MHLTAFYDRYHQKNHLYRGVISKNNFTYFYTLPFLHKALRIAEQNVQKDNTPVTLKVLDVGCGVGALSLYVASLGHTVTGIDISQRAIDIAHKAQKSSKLPVTFQLQELSQLKEKNFDLIICSEVIEHIADDNTFAQELFAKLKPGGVLYLSTPSSQNLLTKIGYYQKFDEEVGHLRRYTAESIQQVLRQSEFKIHSQRNVEGPLRNILFTSPLGFLIKFIRGPLIPLFHFFDWFSAVVFGASDIQVVAQKKSNRPLNILHITPKFWPDIGGVETHVKRVSEELVKMGHTVTVLTSLSDTATDFSTIKKLPNIALYKLEVKKGFFHKFSLWQEIKKHTELFEAADVIHVHDVVWWLLPIFFMFTHKISITFHGWETKWPIRWQAKLQRWFWSQYAQSTLHVGDWIREFYWDDPDAVTYGAVDVPTQTQYKQWPRKNGKLQVVFLGRLAPDNQVLEYAKATQLLRKEYTVEMKWVGEGPLYEDTSWRSKHDAFLGAQTEYVQHIKDAHIVFANSYLSVLEGQAYGGLVGVLEGSQVPIKQRYFKGFPTRDSLVIGKTAEELVENIQKIAKTSQSVPEELEKTRATLRQLSWKHLAEKYLSLWKNETAHNQLHSLTFLTQTHGLGGAEAFNADLLKELQGNGVAVTAYTTSKTYAQRLHAEGLVSRQWFGVFDVIGDWKGFLKSLLWLPLLWVQTLLILQKQKRSQMVVMSGFGEKLFVTGLAKAFNKRIVWIEFSPLDSVWEKFNGLPKKRYLNALKNVDRVITPTEYGKLGLIKGGLPSEKIIVIPCGRKHTHEIDENAQGEGSPISEKYVVCVSRFQPGKGQDTLLHSWAEIVDRFPHYKLVLVGGGDSEWQMYLEGLVKQLEVEKAVVFAGTVESVWQWLANAEVAVFPSQWQLEGFGLVMIEAMALGKPVVAFNHGPVSEVIEHQKTGYLVESEHQGGAVKGLAHALGELLESKDSREKLGRNGKKKFESTFSIELIGKKYFEELSKVL